MVDYEKAVNKIRAKSFMVFPTSEFGKVANQQIFSEEQLNNYKKEVDDLLDLLGFTVMEKAGLKLLL